MENKLLSRHDLAAAAEKFAAAAKASRQHSEMSQAMLDKHGDHGPLISAVVRDHFPEDDKATLRDLAMSVGRLNDEGMALRPKGVRFSTMLSLARAVVRRDGSGFYGFRV